MIPKLTTAAIAARFVAAVVAGFCLAAQAPAAGPTPAEAHRAARDAAAALPAGKIWVTLPQQQDKFGTYGAGANELRFQGGKGNAAPDGATRVGACMSGTDPECLAIQVLRQGRSKASDVVPAGSPQLTGRNLVVGDPAGTTDIDPEATAQVINNVQCQTITTTTPEIRELTTCDATTPYEKLTCTIGTLVEVDPDWVYQCLYRTASNVDSVCSVGQVVVVDRTVTYRCVERLRTMNASTCTVGQVVTVRADTEYQCLVRTRLVGDASCSVGQVVVLDPNYQYQCSANPNAVTSNTCSRKRVVTCANPTDGCAPGGVVLGSVAGDVTASFTNIGSGNWRLSLGTIGDNYWNTCSSIVSRYMTFTVADKNQITQFLLNYVQFDDYMAVKLNGHLIYNGPDGGNSLYLRTWESVGCNPETGECWTSYSWDVCTNTNIPGLVMNAAYDPGIACYSGGQNPERRTNWVRNPSLDLTPYLVSGANTLEFHVIPCGGGEGNVQINTRAYCPQACTDSWDNSACQAYMNRL